MKLSKVYDIDWTFPSDEIKGDQKIGIENFGFKSSERFIPVDYLSGMQNVVSSDAAIRTIIDNMSTGRVHDFSNVKFIYRYPKLNLSRDKVSLFCEDNDIKVIRNKSNADVRIVSYALFNSVFKETWYNEFIPIQTVKEIVIKNHTCFKNYQDILKEIDLIEEDAYVCTARHYYYTPDNIEKYFQPVIRAFNDQAKNYKCRVVIDEKDLDTCKELCSGQFKWMLDEDANKLMSSDSVTLNDEMYLQLKDMITSGNREDITVAMTTLANCNIESSRTYIAILFFHYFETFKNTKTYNTVNFKSLRKAFQKYYDRTSYNYGNATRYDTLIKLLVEDDALTKNAMEHVLDLVFEEVVLKSTGLSNCKEVFKIERSSISLTPDMQNKVNNVGFSQAVKEAHTLEINDGLPF